MLSERTTDSVVGSYLGLVHHIVRNTYHLMPDHRDYEDIVQDGLIGAWRAVDRYGMDVSVSLVGKSVRGCIIDGIRKRLGRHGQRTALVQALPIAVKDEAFGVETGYEFVETMMTLATFMPLLTSREQEVIHYRLAGYAPIEIAAALGVTPSRIMQIQASYLYKLRAVTG